MLLEHHYLADIMGATNRVVESCFGEKLATDYEKKIDHLKWLFVENGLKITPKLHILFEHVNQFLRGKTKGLGQYSEQAAESLHYEFGEFFKNYKSKADSPQKEQKARSAIIQLNAKNIFKCVKNVFVFGIKISKYN